MRATSKSLTCNTTCRRTSEATQTSNSQLTRKHATSTSSAIRGQTWFWRTIRHLVAWWPAQAFSTKFKLKSNHPKRSHRPPRKNSRSNNKTTWCHSTKSNNYSKSNNTDKRRCRSSTVANRCKWTTPWVIWTMDKWHIKQLWTRRTRSWQAKTRSRQPTCRHSHFISFRPYPTSTTSCSKETKGSQREPRMQIKRRARAETEARIARVVQQVGLMQTAQF